MIRKFVVASDSYKGTISAERVCEIVSENVKKHIPDAEVKAVPMADGGEGMIDSYMRFMGGEKKFHPVRRLDGEMMECEFGMLDQDTAIIEMAKCAGITLTEAKTPIQFNTYGVGELIRHAKDLGVKKIIVGIGGSGTNDLGIGMAAALGYKFWDSEEREVEPYVYNFDKIEKITKPVETIDYNIVVACDVDNPLCGERGATYVFGPQKGVKPEELATLDQSLERLGKIIERDLSVQILELPGAGAAGGLGAGLAAFANARLQSGIDLILETVKFDELIKDVDIVFTGEGCIDWQSAYGKVPVGVSRYAQQADVPCIALCGAIGKNASETYKDGITSIFSSITKITTMDEIIKNCEENLRFIVDSVIRTIVAVDRVK